MNTQVQTSTKDDFQRDVIESKAPVLVDFWAPWCAPCRMVGPILDEIATDYAGRAKVVKVNVEEERELAGMLGIRSIPTIALYNGGEVADVLVGARPKGDYAASIDKVLTG